MHRSHQNLVPVTNKYLEYQRFLRDQETHRHKVKTIRGLLDQSTPTPRLHCFQRLKEKQMREERAAKIDEENERLRSKMLLNGSFTDSHNQYVSRSLNKDRIHRETSRHQHNFERLGVQIKQARTHYPSRDYLSDYDKQQLFKSRISRYPPKSKA